MASEAQEIELEGLGFHHFFVGDIVNEKSGKIGLIGLWAKGGEFWADKGDPVIAISMQMFALKGIQKTGVILSGEVRGLFSEML